MFSRLLKRWEISASTGSHFDVLDGLRGVAILLVVCSHAFYVNPSQSILQKLINYGLIQGGWMGVPIFFVLSGFLISYPFFQRRATDPHFWYQRGYAWRRLGKIVPPFYFSIILFVVFYWLQFHDSAYLEAAFKWATGAAHFTAMPVSFNISYWSLLVESHFYVLLPILFWLTRGLNLRVTTLVLFLILFTIPLLTRHITWPANMSVWPDESTLPVFELIFRRFPNSLDYFAWGVAFAGVFVGLGKLREQIPSLSSLGYLGAGLLLASMLFWGFWIDEFNIKANPTRWSLELAHFLPSLAALLLLFFVFDRQCLGSRFLSLPWLRFTGVISFEWFLFHGPICHWFLEHGGHTYGNILAYAWKTLLPVVVTFIFSALVYRYFSLPILNRVRERLKSPTRPDRGLTNQ